MKFLKYILAVATLILACATFALADDAATVATVNGQPYSSLSDAVSNARLGDKIILVSDTTVSSSLNIYGDFYLPAGVSLSSNSAINFHGMNNSFYGDIVSTSSSLTNFISIYDGVSNFYGNVYTNLGSRAVTIREDAPSTVRVNVFGGSFSGSLFGFRNNKDAENLLIMGGSFSPEISGPYLLNGSNIVSENPLIVSWGGLYEIGQIVNSALTWISLFCAVIVANKLLLIFILFVIGFVGIGCIKRIINN